MRRFMFLSFALVVALVANTAQAGPIIWGNNACFGGVNLEAFNTPSGVRATAFLVPDLTARADNGRGVAVVGNDVYYTTASLGTIWKTDVTGTVNQVVVNTGFSGIANVASDGIFLYANNYQANNNTVNKYTLAGAAAGSVVFSGVDAAGADLRFRDGFEVQNNPNISGGALTFIMNRFDGGFGNTHVLNGASVTQAYDVYNAAGLEIISGFIVPGANGINAATGIAYDGNHYFVSDINGNRLGEYSGTGVFLGFISLAGNPGPPNGQGRALEDLSAVGNTITNPSGVPLPPSAILMGLGGLSLLGKSWRRRKVAA